MVALRKLKISLALCFIFAIGEFLGGYFSGSLAIMTDAAHLLSDGAGLLVSYVAFCCGNSFETQTGHCKVLEISCRVNSRVSVQNSYNIYIVCAGWLQFIFQIVPLMQSIPTVTIGMKCLEQEQV